MSLERENKRLAEWIEELDQKLGLQEQKAVEVQKDLLKCEVDRQNLAAELHVSKMREDRFAALHEAHKKHPEEKQTLRSEMDIYQAKVSAYM